MNPFASTPMNQTAIGGRQFGRRKKNSEVEQKEIPRVPIAVARDRAKLMHAIYLATLEVMHDRYFHADRAIVPARAMEDVFSYMDDQTGSQANWISVNLKAMSINHEPKTDFEKRAAREIVIGEDRDRRDRRWMSSLDSVTGGCIVATEDFLSEQSSRAVFRWCGRHCISCHGGFSPQRNSNCRNESQARRSGGSAYVDSVNVADCSPVKMKGCRSLPPSSV